MWHLTYSCTLINISAVTMQFSAVFCLKVSLYIILSEQIHSFTHLGRVASVVELNFSALYRYSVSHEEEFGKVHC